MLVDAAQRYRNAVRKAQIRSTRNVRLAMEGKMDVIPCGHPEPDLIKAIQRAYEDGFAAGRRRSSEP